MQIDLEKKVNVVDAYEMIVKLSEKYLDVDSTNDLKRYLDLRVVGDYAEEEEDDHSERLGRTCDLISELISDIPKRIERLSEMRAPQVIIDSERSTLESLKKINNNLG